MRGAAGYGGRPHDAQGNSHGSVVNLEKGLDKAWENKSLDEILAAPPSALAGLTEKHDAALADALNIKTIGDLGSNKYVALAVALAELGSLQG